MQQAVIRLVSYQIRVYLAVFSHSTRSKQHRMVKSFTANLAINGESRIYRWASETADPVLVFADSLGQRLGDSFGVIGSGDSVHVFLSGTGATKVVPFFWDGTTLTKKADYTVAASEARGGFLGMQSRIVL